MKLKHTILTTGAFLSAAYMTSAFAGENIRPDQVTSLKQIASLVHHKADAKNHPKPPRIVSPKRYQEMQKLMSHEHANSDKMHSNETINISKRLKNIAKSSSVASVTSAAGCSSTTDLLSLSGQELVESVKGGSLSSCLYGLFDNSLAGEPIFSDANLLTIAKAINTALAGYDADNLEHTQQLEKLVMFLRAMHWVEGSTGRIFNSDYMAELKLAFDSYFAGAHFVEFKGDVTRNFMIKYEMLVLVNSSSSDRQPYLKRFTEALLGYANSVSRTNDWGVYYEEMAVTGLLTQLFNANTYEESAFAATIAAQPEIVTNLIQFVTEDGLWLVDHTRQYQWSDAISELGRLLKLGGVVADTVRPTIQSILSTYEFGGTGSAGWVNAQNMVKNYDSANCSIYGEACNFDLESEILSNIHQCSAQVTMRYQGVISAENLSQTCATLVAGQNKFHSIFGTTPQQPVVDDYNEALEVVVFSSSTDYESYAGQFFGISTDNGGMYLEGDPEVEGNQARFIAFQATWLPEFAIWNLEHEQYHYLDGRFNKWGDFNDSPENDVWWGEGLAEYLSQPDSNSNALAEAPKKTYRLSELFQTTYANSNQVRTYYWGYLATRFMMENHRDLIDNELLPTFRARKYAVIDVPEENNEGCTFDWGWEEKPIAEENNWLWLYDDGPDYGYSGSGYWVWTCGQPNDGSQPEPEPEPDTPEIPEFTPYDDILANWGTTMDDEFDQWLDCIVAGNGACQQQTFRVEDIDQNGAVDKRDVNLFQGMLRNNEELGLEYDFNGDNQVNRRDVRAMTALCDLARCAIAQQP